MENRCAKELARGIHAGLAIVSILTLFACQCEVSGGIEEGDEDPAVEVTDQHFAPEKVTIRVGRTVTWRNTSHVVRTITDDPALAPSPKDARLPASATPFDSGEIGPGQSYSQTFTVPGTYKYVSVSREGKTMVGEIEVKPAREKK